ncbi:glycosyltransferase family 2 protein [Streptomyces sp. S6]
MPRPKWVRAREQYDLPAVEKVAERVRYSLLVPAVHEPYLDVMFSRLSTIGRRDFEVLLLVHPNDESTLRQARRLEKHDSQRYRVITVVSSPPRLAADLNEGLPHCNGEVVGFLEVGDTVEPSLLHRVDGAFRASGVDVVRLAVDVPPVLSAGEVAQRTDGLVQVRGRRPVRVTEHFWRGHSGGYFVRADLLRLLGGWDDDCTTEELELMLRLFSYGARGAVLYGQETRLVSKTSRLFIAQARVLFNRRVRRHIGLLQIYRTGEWRRVPSRFRRWAVRLSLVLPLVRDVIGLPTVLLGGLLNSNFTHLPNAVQLGWGFFLTALLIGSDADSVLWSRLQNRQGRPWWYTASSLAVLPVMFTLNVLTRAPAALTALFRYLLYDTRVLNAHFERSLLTPPPRRAAEPAPPPAPGDLLDLASSPYTPSAAQNIAAGLETLFTTLGPPPEAQRLAGTGPAPKGDGGAGDG